MKHRFSTITVEAEVDLDDVLREMTVDDLMDELKRRKNEATDELVDLGLEQLIEIETGRIIESMTNDEISGYVLKKLNRI